jgi:N12 class adenine-specific DNA methylase
VDAFDQYLADNAEPAELETNTHAESQGDAFDQYLAEQQSTPLQDSARALASGIPGVAGALGYGIEKTGIAPQLGRSLQESSKQETEKLMANQSPQWQQDADNKLFNDDGSFNGDYNFNTFLADTLPSVAGTVVMAPMGGPLAKAAETGAKLLGLGSKLAPMVARSVAPEAAAAIDTAIGSGIGFGAAEGLFSGAQNASEFEMDLRSKPEEYFANSPAYHQAFAQTDPTLPHDQRAALAKEDVISKAGSQLFKDTAIQTGGISAVTGGGMFGVGRQLRNQATEAARDGLVKGMIKGMGAEALQEAPQSGTEARNTNIAMRDFVNPDQDINAGVLDAAARGGISGGAMGVAGGLGTLNRGPMTKALGAGDPQALNATQPAGDNNAATATNEPVNGVEPGLGSGVGKGKKNQTGHGDVSTVTGEAGADNTANNQPDAALGVGTGTNGLDQDTSNPPAPTSQPLGDNNAEPGLQTNGIQPSSPAGESGRPAEPNNLAETTVGNDAGATSEPSRDQSTVSEAGNATTQSGPEYQSANAGMADSGTGMSGIGSDANGLAGAGTTESGTAAQNPLKDQIDAAAHEAATSPANGLSEPTQAQKDAGNYKKGHIKLQGLDIAIENPQGSKRKGIDQDGNAWESDMAHHYGYIKGTIGADKDHVDTFIGPNPDSQKAFVVNQIDPKTGKFDEHKIMLGFDSEDEANKGYHANYDKNWKGAHSIVEMSIDDLKDRIKDDGFKQLIPANPKEEQAPVAYHNMSVEEFNAKHPKASAPDKAPAPATAPKPVPEAPKAFTHEDRETGEQYRHLDGDRYQDAEGAVWNFNDGELAPLNNQPQAKTDQPKPEVKAEADPILAQTKAQWLADRMKEAGVKKGDRTYDKTRRGILDTYDDKLDRALAALPFDEFAAHPSHIKGGTKPSANVLRSAYDALRTEFDIEGETTPAAPKVDVAKMGAWTIEQRKQNAANRFKESASDQFGLTDDEAQKALDYYLKNKLVKLDSGTGQFNLSDGRLWDGEALKKAANPDKPAAKPEKTNALKEVISETTKAADAVNAETQADKAILEKSKTEKLPPNARVNGDKEKAAAERLEKVIEHIEDFKEPLKRNSRPWNGKQKLKDMISELRKPYTVSSVDEILNSASNDFLGPYPAISELIDEIAESINTLPSVSEMIRGLDATDEKSQESPDTRVSSQVNQEYQAKWDAMDYSARQEIAKNSIYKNQRPIVHRLSGSKWAAISEGEQESLIKAMAEMDDKKPASEASEKSLFQGAKDAGIEAASGLSYWKDKEATKAEVKVAILDHLMRNASSKYTADDIKAIAGNVYKLVEQQAPSEDRHKKTDNQETAKAPKVETKTEENQAAQDKDRFADNKLFTADKVAAARARLKSKLGTLNSGIDPEILVDGMTIAGAYIEAGVRDFSAYAKAMVEDLGDGVKPYLLSFWEGARAYPGLNTQGMTNPEESAKLHQALLTPEVKEAAKEVIGEGVVKAQKAKPKANGQMTLTQDWGVDDINGWEKSKTGKNEETDYGLKGGVKDEFLGETQKFMTQVAKQLEAEGFEAHKDGRGRAEKIVTVSEAGPAVSGDVTMVMRKDNIGVSATIGVSTIRGLAGNHPQGVAIMIRVNDKAGTDRYAGQNVWLAPDLNATELANELSQRAARLSERATKPTTTQESKDNATTTTTENISGSTAQGDTERGAPGNRNSEPVAPGLAGTRQTADSEQSVQPSAPEPIDAGKTSPSGKSSDAPIGDGKTSTGRTDTGAADNQLDDYTIEESDEIGKGGLGKKYKDNLAAIKIIKAVEAEKRTATLEERKQLAKYVGWGALKGVFDPANKQWAKQHAELKALLTKEEWESARTSTLNAHYTIQAVISSMYEALDHLGFKGGRILEPSLGAGNFFGLMPASVRNNSQLHGVELDNLTGRLAKALYPNAVIDAPKGFEAYEVPNGYFDLAIGNPPFGSEPIVDKERNAYSGFSIHNYFLARMIDKVRENGLVSVVVSHNFLDAMNSKAREWIAQRANLLGAVRLPNNTFKENAGTEVVTDLLFFQKTANPEKNPDWLNVTDIDILNSKTGEQVKAGVNDYFLANPRHVLGKHSAAGSMYSDNEYTVEDTGETKIDDRILSAIRNLPADIYRAVERSSEELNSVDNTIPDGVKPGSYFINGQDEIRQRGNDVAGQRVSYPVVPRNNGVNMRMRGMIQLRELLRKQMRLERDPRATEQAIETNRAKLNTAYDKFVKSYGFVNSTTNRSVFNEDTESALVQALEFDYDAGVTEAKAKSSGLEEKPASAVKADILERRVLFPPSDTLNVETAKDALLASLNEKGRLDMDFMKEVYAQDEQAIVDELGDIIFKDPLQGYVPADEYLSGDVKTKLADAKAALKDDPAYARNVAALEKIIPADKVPSEIFASPGAAWIPSDVYEAFGREITGGDVTATYQPVTASWYVNVTGGDINKMSNEYGTQRMPAGDIFGLLMNGRPVDIKKKVSDGNGGYRYVTDEEATEGARQRMDKIKAAWDSWVWSDGAQATRLAKIYNDRHNRVVNRHFDGRHLTLPGITPAITLRVSQLNAIWRAIQERNILLDHVVGAGKTYAKVAIAMEMRRLGIARKPLFIVPNHLTMQWRSDFTRLYPASTVLAATPEDFSKDNRERLFGKIATGDFDAIIIGHSSLKKLGLAPDIEARMYNEQIQAIADAIEDLKRERGDRRIVSDMERIKKNLAAKVQALANKAGERDKLLTFDELGIDSLFIDEMHEFKNLFFTTQKQRVSGLGNPAGSGKAFDLFIKIRWLQEALGERAPLITATGTPVSNSLSEMFTMQRYMRYDELERDGLHLFDAWSRMYGEDEYVYEVAPSGVGYRISQRFAKFKNLPSLMSHYHSFADVVTLQDLKDQSAAEGKRFPVPNIAGGRQQNIVAQRSELQRDFFGVPVIRLDDNGKPVFEINEPEKIEIQARDSDEGKKFVLVNKDTQQAISGPIATQEEAELELVEKAMTPVVDIDPKSIVGQFGNLKELSRRTNGRINALSLTGLANKAGLDYRLIDPSAPDFPGSKINLAVDNMMRLYKQWDPDKGAQLVFSDLSVPLSARASAASKERRVYVRDENRELTHKRGTLHTIEGREGFPFYLVRVGKKEQARVTLYDATTGLIVRNNFKDKKEAQDWYKDRLDNEDNRDRLFDQRDEYAITADQLDEYRDENELEVAEDGSNEINLEELESMAAPASFSVYDDIKAKLIRRGVKEHEIAFIHDYNTPKQKADLYKRVNRGDVRFLLGSTAKLGAGTNVQERMVGLHHIDAPWRPSDLEQREGRIIRQGNALYLRDPDGFEVFIGRYATEQTYDTRRWQLLEHKAAGIEQLRKYSGESEIEDVASEASNAADMKAAASGNPLILEETKLRNEVKRLTLLRRSHSDNVFSMQRETDYLHDVIDTKQKAIQRLKSMVATSSTVKAPAGKDKIPDLIINGKTYQDKKAAIDAIEKTIQGVHGVSKGVDQKAEITYRGLTFRLVGKVLNTALYSPYAPENSFTTNMENWSVEDTISPSGLLTRFHNYIETLPGRMEDAQYAIENAKERIEGYKQGIAKPFEDQQALDDAIVQHKEVQRRLMKSSQLDAVPEEKRKEFLKDLAERKDQLSKLGYDQALKEAGHGDDDLASFVDDEALSEKISIDGVERWTVNSEGRLIAETEDGIRKFWRWFSDSAVVDDEGRPLVVYHGKDKNVTFEVFDIEKLGENTISNASDDAFSATSLIGFWFNSEHMNNKSPYDDEISAYIKIENARNEVSTSDLAEIVREHIAGDLEDDFDNDKYYYLKNASDSYRNKLEQDGYDGIVVDDEEFGGKSFVVFNSNQIKSAIGNNGEFDPENTDIRFSQGELTKGSTTEQIKTILPDYARNALKTGKLRIVQSFADIPGTIVMGGVQVEARQGAKLRGLYRQKNDTLYLIADNLNQDNLVSYLNHELFHRAELTDKKLIAAMQRFEDFLKTRMALTAKGKGSAIEREAYVSLTRAKTPDAHKLAEFKAYMITHYNKAPGSLPARVGRMIQDFVASIRAALIRAGVPFKSITPADLNALAKYGSRVGDVKPGRGGDLMALDTDNTTLDEAFRRAGLGPKKTLLQSIKEILARGVQTNWELAKLRWADIKPQLEQGIFDRFLGIKLAEQEILGDIVHDESGYIGARLSTNSNGPMTGLLLYGAPEWKDGIIQRKDGSEGLAAILEPVKDDLKNFTGWMVGKRAARLSGEGRENNLTPEHIRELLLLGKDKPHYAQVAAGIASLNKAVLDLAQQAGLIDAKSRKLFEHADYIPFYRMVEDSKAKAPGNKAGLTHQSSGIRMLKGGVDPLSDPLGNMMMNWSHLIDASMKNSALDKTIVNLEDTRFMTKVPRVEFKRALVPKNQIKTLMQEAGLPEDLIDLMPDELTEGIANLWSMQAPTDPDVVRVMRSGKSEYYKVHDGMLLTALTAVNQSPLTGIFKPLRTFKRLLTGAITADPTFMARNFIRDSMHSWTIAEEKGFKLGLDSFHGAAKSFQEEGGYVDMLFSGASFQGGYGNYSEPDVARESMDAALRRKGIKDIRGFKDSVLDTPKKYWEAYRAIGDAIENANREAILENAKRAGASKAQYLFESKDLMDFSMQGSFTLIRALSDMLPFFNARLVGLYRLAKAGQSPEAKRRILMKGATIAGLTLALLYLNSDNDDYEALEDWDKDAYWHFFAGEQHYRIPKPFELGLVFGTIPERAARLMAGRDELKEFGERMAHGASDTLAFNPIPQMLRPFFELYANKDMFTGRPIENMSDEGKLPAGRYNEFTSETMRLLSSLMPEWAEASPKRLEHLVHGYTGAMGMYVLGATDMLVRTATDMPDLPEMRIDRLPVVRAFYQEQPAMHTKYGTQFYDMLSEVNQIKKTIDAYRREGNIDKARELYAENSDKLRFQKPLSRVGKHLSELRKSVDFIYRDRTLTPIEKRRRIDSLMQQANASARKAVELSHPYFQ